MSIIKVVPLIKDAKQVIRGIEYDDLGKLLQNDLPIHWSKTKKARHDPAIPFDNRNLGSWNQLHLVRVFGRPGTLVSPAYRRLKTWRRKSIFPFFHIIKPMTKFNAFKASVEIRKNGVVCFGMRAGYGRMKVAILSSEEIDGFVIKKADNRMKKDFTVKHSESLNYPTNELFLF